MLQRGTGPASLMPLHPTLFCAYQHRTPMRLFHSALRKEMHPKIPSLHGEPTVTLHRWSVCFRPATKLAARSKDIQNQRVFLQAHTVTVREGLLVECDGDLALLLHSTVLSREPSLLYSHPQGPTRPFLGRENHYRLLSELYRAL